jgi:hypothetical protein
VLGFAIVASQPPTQVPVHETAMVMVRAFEAAHREAHAQERQMRMLIERGTEGSPGRFAAFSQELGEEQPEDVLGWENLPANVLFSQGLAEAGPMGDTIVAAVPMAHLQCVAGEGCDFPADAVMLTWYMSSLLDPEQVRAVVITRLGNVRLYRYEHTERRWR